jgi:hypothetical protein
MRTFRRGLSALVAAGLGVAGLSLAAGAAAAAPAPAHTSTLPAVVSASGTGASAVWAGHDTVKLTVGTPSTTTFAQIMLKPAPKNAPATPPSFTTDNYTAGSPRWVITFSDGCYIFGYPAQIGGNATTSFNGNQWSVQGNSNCHPGGADVSYATALNDVSPAGSATVTGAYIVADGDQLPGTTDTVSALQYGGEQLTVTTHAVPPSVHWVIQAHGHIKVQYDNRYVTYSGGKLAQAAYGGTDELFAIVENPATQATGLETETNSGHLTGKFVEIPSSGQLFVTGHFVVTSKHGARYYSTQGTSGHVANLSGYNPADGTHIIGWPNTGTANEDFGTPGQ